MLRTMITIEEKKYVPAYLFVILRIYLGVILIYTVYGKLSADTPFVDEMLVYLKIMMGRGRMPSFYLHFLQTVVIPHAKMFSYMVMAGELTAGIGLLTGTCTRLCALIALLLFLNFMLSKGRWFWSPDSEDAAVFFIAFVLIPGRAGRLFGVDQFLAKKWPKSLLW
jgi:thiosulfate dehydrogenase [quinone] large subunit